MDTIRVCKVGNGTRLHEFSNIRVTHFNLARCGLEIGFDERCTMQTYSLANMTHAIRRQLCKTCVQIREK